MEHELIKKIKQLRETEHRLVEAIAESDAEAIREQLRQYRSLKKQIKLATIESPVVAIPGPEHREERELLQKLKLGEPLQLEAAFAGTKVEELFRDELKMEEMDDLGHDIFY